MSNTYIPKSVQHEVWWKAAGRCEFKGVINPYTNMALHWTNVRFLSWHTLSAIQKMVLVEIKNCRKY